VELRDLRALATVVRSGSFTAAALELGYTQSAVSQQVAALEREVGQRLLERRPVRPTPAGLRLAEHAGRILLRVDVVRSELTRMKDTGQELRVDACPLAVPDALATALRELRRDRPSLHVTVRSTGAGSAVNRLATGATDVAVIDGITAPETPLAPTEPGLFSATGLTEEPLAVALPEDHPLAGRPWLDLSMLADAPWMALPELATESAMPAARSAVTYEGNDVATVLHLVAAGHGTALLPAPVSLRARGVVAVPVRHPPLVHRTEVLTLRSADPPVTTLVEALRIRARPM